MGKANETLFVSNQSFNAITFFKKFEGKVGAQQAICSGNENLVILGHMDLEAIEKKVKEAGGKIVLETFSFPGGRRFHFKDPTGNELAIWSET